MRKIKKGDQLRCIDNEGYPITLKIGSVYTAASDEEAGVVCPLVVLSGGTVAYTRRFEIVEAKGALVVEPIRFIVLGQTLSEREAMDLYRKLDSLFGGGHV